MMSFTDLAQKALHGFYSNNDLSGLDGLTLEMVLSNTVEYPFRLQDFQEYLQQTYCNENLLFYQAVTEYKEKCNIYFGFLDEEKTVLLSDGISLFNFTSNQTILLSTREKLWFETLKNRFETILQEFILSDAPQEINLPYEIKHQLLQSYQLEQSYHPTLLYPACHAVIELLRISAFIPFATDPNRLSLYQKKLSEGGFLKRLTTTFKSSRPIDPPPPRLSCWKQINVPDLTHFKSPVNSISSSSSTTTITSSNSNNCNCSSK